MAVGLDTPGGTPSGRIVAAAMREVEVVDALGRRLCVRRPGALDRLRLFKAAGPVLAGNERWLGLAMLAFSVTAIDDVPVPQPGSEAALEALVERLGDAGTAAAAAALSGRDDVAANGEVAEAGPGN